MTRSGVTDPDTQPWGSSTAPSGNRTSLLCAPASESSRETASPTTPEVLTGVFRRCTGGQASPRVTSDVVTAGDPKQQLTHRHRFHCREGDGWMAGCSEGRGAADPSAAAIPSAAGAGFVLKAQSSSQGCPGSRHPSARPGTAQPGCSGRGERSSVPHQLLPLKHCRGSCLTCLAAPPCSRETAGSCGLGNNPRLCRESRAALGWEGP